MTEIIWCGYYFLMFFPLLISFFMDINWDLNLVIFIFIPPPHTHTHINQTNFSHITAHVYSSAYVVSHGTRMFSEFLFSPFYHSLVLRCWDVVLKLHLALSLCYETINLLLSLFTCVSGFSSSWMSFECSWFSASVEISVNINSRFAWNYSLYIARKVLNV